MKIVVIGGSGRIGLKTVGILRDKGHEVVAASPDTGVNTLTGEGLVDALAGTQVVIDVANSPTFDERALEFFETSGRNLLAAEVAAGVGHHLALSVVGTERLLESPYFRAKMAQENLIRTSVIPYTILHSTQFFEFVSTIVRAGSEGEVIRLPPAMIQPIVSDDVAGALAALALGPPLGKTVEIAGPETFRLDELARMFLKATSDRHEVITDPRASYYGVKVGDRALLPGALARQGSMTFETWLNNSVLQLS